MSRPFRFGVQASSLVGADGKEWAALARKCEDLGYATLTVADHFDASLAPTPALMAAADATTTLRIGALVWCNDYRHPVVLAKEAATIDVLSGGRLDVGIGAGWMTADYDASGIPLDRAGVRIERLEEAIDVLHGLWAPGRFTYEGTQYRIDGLDGRPKPVQEPRPPILVGGGGRRVLSLAGRKADIVGINIDLRSGTIDATSGVNGTVAATDEKIGWVREAAGSRFDDLELQVRVHLAVVTDDRAGVAETLAPAFGLPPDEALASPHALVGSVDELVDDLVARRERWGISSIGLSLDAVDALAPLVSRLAGS